MTEIFLHIVNMSITASVLAGIVLLLRLLLQKAPKWISVLLWGLVAIRLICPFALESSFSLIPKTDWIEQETVSEEDLFLNSVPDSIPAFDSSSFGKDITVHYYPIENPEIEIHRGVSISFILSCVWAAGMMTLLLHTVISTIRLRRSIGAAIRVRDKVWESSAVDSPFVLGLFLPRIYVPRGMTEENLAYVIAHEEAHIRRRDHWWKPLGFLLLTVHWFNPVIWLAYILLCRDIEMACDERVVRDMGDVERADYSEALLECSVKRSMLSACPLAFGEVGVKQRIKSVLNYKKPAFWIVVLAVIACIAAAVCFLTNPMVKNTPADILNDMKVSEVEWAQVTIWNDERDTVLLSEEQIIELTEILQSIDSSEYKRKNIESNVTVMLYCGEKEILLHYDNGYVGFTFDSVTAASLGNISWVVQNEILNLFIDTISHNVTEQADTSVIKSYLTLEDVITLSAKGYDLTWEDFEQFNYIETGSGLYIRVYEIDETFELWIGGGDMESEPMYIRLKLAGDPDAQAIDIRDGGVEEFIESIEKPLLNVPKPVNDYQNDIIESVAESIFGAVTVYVSGIDKLEQVPTATVGISEEILLYRLDYWITKGINGLTGTPPEDIYRESVYFAMFNDWTSDTWTRLGTITETEIDELYNTAPMLELYGNKYTATASQMYRKHLLPVEFTAVINEFDTDAFENGLMSLNIVEFITPDDTERIAELELSDQDLISGYYIHDEDESITTLKLPADTEFIFFDWRDAYTDESDDRYEILSERWVSTRDAELFYEYWLPYADGPGYPFSFYAEEGGKVVIKEIPLM